jgi:hypothetical protein
VSKRLFTFVQMELPWELGPADGRYLLRVRGGQSDGEPEHVVVFSTVGAERRRMLGNRSRTRPTGADPARVPVARVTVVDPVGLAAERQAQAWLEELDPEHEAQAATGVLNRVLFAHRIAAAHPHVHEISPRQALVIRAGFGEGEQVADGLWLQARELLLSHRRELRRATALRPQERLAVLLSGRGSALLCEELTLRARVDLDAGRLGLAAIELDRAYLTALKELPREKREDLRHRIEELRKLSTSVAGAAHAELLDGAAAGQVELPDEQIVLHALERLEAALRARTAPGFASS